MEESTKIFLVVFLAVLMSLVGFDVKGGFGAVMGFVLTILIIGFFNLWKRYSNSD